MSSKNRVQLPAFGDSATIYFINLTFCKENSTPNLCVETLEDPVCIQPSQFSVPLLYGLAFPVTALKRDPT